MGLKRSHHDWKNLAHLYPQTLKGLEAEVFDGSGRR
jgi:hypothetical protein